jgi:hypothetical protein
VAQCARPVGWYRFASVAVWQRLGAGEMLPPTPISTLTANARTRAGRLSRIMAHGVAGYAGIGVRLSAGDQRMYVSFGPRAATEIAASETLTPFNDFYKGVIEWRLEKQQDGKARPFAAIARWNVARAADNLGKNGKVSGRVLVVTRLGPGAVCHVGYVVVACI